MSHKPTHKSNWPKYTLQWGVLALLIFFLSGLAAKIFVRMEPADPETYCPMGGIEAFITYIVGGTLPCTMSTMQIIMGIALAASIVFFSKLFCGYLCPVGSVEDLLSNGRKALKINALVIRNGSVADKILRIVKYGLLFWIVYMTVSSSELFCKNLDPYYAVATGFKGEITLWMSLVAIGIVILLGFVVDRFWCKYICPLGAVSNSLKFWVWMVLLAGICWALNVIGVHIPWIWFLGAFCLLGYLLEILNGKPKLQILHVVVDQNKCTRQCYSCQKSCPYTIDIPSYNGKVTDVDCVLCGECVTACPVNALSIGAGAKGARKPGFTRFLPAIIAVLLVVCAYIIGGQFELPTINETWAVPENVEMQTVKVENLKSVKCYGSSMAFKARMEKVAGVHGVKTFVKSHTVVISFDPTVTSAEKIQEEIFVPSHFRISNPDPSQYPALKVKTIRTERMSDKLDLNYLGMQMRLSGKKIFGLESEYNCPLIIRVYMDPAEQADDVWFKEIVEKKSLDMPTAKGGIKSTPLDFEFVRMEKEEGSIKTTDYLQKMFDGFSAEFNGEYPSADTTAVIKRSEYYKGKPQSIYEIADANFEKPIIRRYLPYLSNHLSKEEGVIALNLVLNADYVPAVQIRFAEPMTADKLWALMTMDTWTITYAKDDVRQEAAKIDFETPGRTFPYTSAE